MENIEREKKENIIEDSFYVTRKNIFFHVYYAFEIKYKNILKRR